MLNAEYNSIGRKIEAIRNQEIWKDEKGWESEVAG